jgi:hypothetical protein
MEIHVYDTYVKAADGHTMHFDVITGEKDHDKALTYGKEWLASVGEGENVNSAIHKEHQSLLNRQLRKKATLSKRWKAVLNHFSFLFKNIFLH